MHTYTHPHFVLSSVYTVYGTIWCCCYCCCRSLSTCSTPNSPAGKNLWRHILLLRSENYTLQNTMKTHITQIVYSRQNLHNDITFIYRGGNGIFQPKFSRTSSKSITKWKKMLSNEEWENKKTPNKQYVVFGIHCYYAWKLEVVLVWFYCYKLKWCCFHKHLQLWWWRRCHRSSNRRECFYYVVCETSASVAFQLLAIPILLGNFRHNNQFNIYYDFRLFMLCQYYWWIQRTSVPKRTSERASERIQ